MSHRYRRVCRPWSGYTAYGTRWHFALVCLFARKEKHYEKEILCFNATVTEPRGRADLLPQCLPGAGGAADGGGNAHDLLFLLLFQHQIQRNEL